jgi:sterol 3beta-glucosyltransferase
MKVVLAPVGTRGDVQPLVALGLRLRQRGHTVLVSAPVNFASFVAGYGLLYAPNAPDYGTFLQEVRSEAFIQVLARQIPEQFRMLSECAAGADVIVGSMLQLAGPSVAQKEGAAYYYMVPAPVFCRSRALPPVTVRCQNLPAWLNELAWRVRGWTWNRALRAPLNRERAHIGLPPVRDAQDHVLHTGHVLMAYDPALATPPVFRHSVVTVTGSWHLDEGHLDESVRGFCERPPRPIFIGFGSMLTPDPEALLGKIVAALTQTGQRAVIGAGWSGLSSNALPESCLLIPGAPFHLLFPKVAAAIHHGGAGTTAAAARAGIPQGIVPHFADQYFWGERIARCGLGPASLPVEKLTLARLAGMIRALVSTPSMKQAAEQLARGLDPEHGLQTATALIEAAATRPRGSESKTS